MPASARGQTPRTPIALAYVRVSTDEQAQLGGSLAMQEARIRAYCQMAGLTLAQVIVEEGVSAAKPLHERPGGARLVAAIAGDHARHIVALKLDRLFRDAADALTRIRDWDHADVALHLVDMGGSAINTASAMGRMMLTVLAGFAEWERNMIAERTAAVLSHKKAIRDVYGSTPLGFARIGDKLVIDPAEQAIVARMQQLHAAGKSLGWIARRLNGEGVPTKQGGRWWPATVRYVLGNRELYGEVPCST